VVGNRIGAGAGDLAEEEAAEPAMALKFAFLLVVGVEEIELAGAIRKIAGDALEQAAHDGFAEGVEEEEQAGARGQWKLDRIAAMNPGWCMDPVKRAPTPQIAASDAGQSRMKFDACHSMKGHFGGEKDRAPHACADIDEGKVADGGDWLCPPPLLEKSVKNGGSDTVVSRGVAIVTMTALEMTTGDEAAGAHAVGRVKWVTHEPIRHGETGQEAALG
jgi:hypothetical protein